LLLPLPAVALSRGGSGRANGSPDSSARRASAALEHVSRTVPLESS